MESRRCPTCENAAGHRPRGNTADSLERAMADKIKTFDEKKQEWFKEFIKTRPLSVQAEYAPYLSDEEIAAIEAIEDRDERKKAICAIPNRTQMREVLKRNIKYIKTVPKEQKPPMVDEDAPAYIQRTLSDGTTLMEKLTPEGREKAREVSRRIRKQEIISMKDHDERRRVISESLDLFL